MNLSFLPAVNAVLNGCAAVLICIGLALIKGGRVTAHRNCMIAAFCVSCLFLVSYVTHYIWRAASAGGAITRFNGTGVWQVVYLSMLASHIVLAMAVPVLAIVMIRLGVQNRLEGHRRLGKFAVPIWLYVSVTGVLIYVVLYHLNPPVNATVGAP